MVSNTKLRSDDDSKCQTENSDGSECQNWETIMALNAKTENDDGSERQNWEATLMALNAETEYDDGSEHQNWRDDGGSERQN